MNKDEVELKKLRRRKMANNNFALVRHSAKLTAQAYCQGDISIFKNLHTRFFPN